MRDHLMTIGNLRGDALEGYAARRPAISRPWWRFGLRVLIAALILAGVSGAVYWALTAETFAVARVDSGAYRYTRQEDLQRVLSGFLGRNIWSLATDEVAQELTTLPWVRDLRISRQLPNNLEVDFREWRPLLIVDVDASGGASPQVLAEDGRLLAFPAHLPPVGLPVLTGATVVAATDGRHATLDPELTGAVLDLMRAIELTGLEAISPVDFLVVQTDGFAVVLQNGQGTLKVGREDFTGRLNRYMVARPHLEPGLEVDLRFADRLTWNQSDAGNSD